MIETVIHERRSSLVGEKNMSHFPFRGSPTTQNTSVSSAPSTPPPQPPTSTSMAVTSSTVPPGARSSSPYSTTSGPPQNPRCCDTGRPIMIDQTTGQAICSCQLDNLNQRLVNAANMSGGIGSLYGAPYGAEGLPYFPGMSSEQLGFYQNMPPGIELKDNLVAASAVWPYPPYYESMGNYGFPSYGLEINGARRKNATRETTSMLKAWLNEHKKNPYPTKGEKIMLAVITKMTLTQVSTWFANARRRLKKENKMTWEPRNRVDDDDATIDDDDNKSTDGKDLLDSKDSGTGSSEDGDRPSNRLDMLDHHSAMMGREWAHDPRLMGGHHSPDICDRNRPPPHLLHPAALHHSFRPMTGSSPDSKQTPGGSTNSNDLGKPRIWSLADMAKKDGKDVESQPSQSGLYGSNAGKILSPLAGRYPIHPSPYPKPDFYRSMYQPNPAHMPPGPLDHQALLEHYGQFYGPGLAHSRLGVMNPLAMKTKPPGGLPHPLTPLNLPTNSTTPPSGVSPSASSTSSGPEITSPVNDKRSSPISVTRP